MPHSTFDRGERNIQPSSDARASIYSKTQEIRLSSTVGHEEEDYFLIKTSNDDVVGDVQ